MVRWVLFCVFLTCCVCFAQGYRYWNVRCLRKCRDLSKCTGKYVGHWCKYIRTLSLLRIVFAILFLICMGHVVMVPQNRTHSALSITLSFFEHLFSWVSINQTNTSTYPWPGRARGPSSGWRRVPGREPSSPRARAQRTAGVQAPSSAPSQGLHGALDNNHYFNYNRRFKQIFKYCI